MNEAYNIDCLEYMRTLPDNAFDLCIADPPYGDGSGVDMNGLSERERDDPGTVKAGTSDSQTGPGALRSGETIQPLRTTLRQVQTPDRYYCGGGATT